MHAQLKEWEIRAQIILQPGKQLSLHVPFSLINVTTNSAISSSLSVQYYVYITTQNFSCINYFHFFNTCKINTASERAAARN